MNRSLFRGLTFFICSAMSRIVAEPDPLSSMPAPKIASRCASTTRTLFGSPPLDSAITFQSSRVSEMVWTSMVMCGTDVPFCFASLYCVNSSLPMSNDVNATGILEVIGSPFASTRLPLITPVRPGLPSLKMTTPVAPAASAFCTFTPKLQPPRWISATLPAVKPLKSPDVQPLVELDMGSMGSAG